MFQFEKISLRQIKILSEVIANSEILTIEFIRTRYIRDAANFDETLDLLTKMNLICIEHNVLRARPPYKKFLNEFMRAEHNESFIKDFLIESLLRNKSDLFKQIEQFLSNFRFEAGRMEFNPSNAERLKFSGLRNFFMELDLLVIEPSTNKYILTSNTLLQSEPLLNHRRVSRSEFLEISAKRQRIGRDAELEILDYEKKRLAQFPYLANQIEHVAEIDVGAGFDIKSFEEKLDYAGRPIPRYIEVKAVSPIGYQFHWTINEIQTAKNYHDKYYLYLLPFYPSIGFVLNCLMIIGDPFLKICENEVEWYRTIDSFSFFLSGTDTDFVHHKMRMSDHKNEQ